MSGAPVPGLPPSGAVTVMEAGCVVGVGVGVKVGVGVGLKQE